MLALENIMIRRDGFALQADVSFQLGITALIGPSGAGKSTLLDIVAGFAVPASGRVLWDGTDITDLTPAERPCAILFQDNNLFPHLTVAQNLKLALGRSKQGGDARALIEKALTDVDLPGYEARKPGALSGGQQARVALARVLLQARPVLLLDEAFSALGPALKSEMLDLVGSAAQDRDLVAVMVSHEPGDAARISQFISIVADGKATSPMPTGDVLASPPASLKAYLGT